MALSTVNPGVEQNYDDPKADTLATIGFVGTLLFIATVIGLSALYFNVQNREIDAKVMNADFPELRQLQTEQRTALSSYRYANPEKTAVAIPIDRAMQLVVEEANRAAKPAAR